MDRRQFLSLAGGAGVVATAGYTTLGGSQSLSDPTVVMENPGRGSLRFTESGEEIASFGVDGGVNGDYVDLSTELWHQDGTNVKSVALRVWMPETDSERVALVSPVEGDSSPPPEVTLSYPRRKPGTVIEVTDLDDLKDETISTLDLIVKSYSETATTINVDVTIELADSGLLGNSYSLDGELELEYPDLV